VTARPLWAQSSIDTNSTAGGFIAATSRISAASGATAIGRIVIGPA